MASAVVSDNFETGSGGVPQLGGADRQNQWCKAWVNFNGTGTVAIRDSFNVASITDDGTGDYTVNFTTAMSDTNYAPVGLTDTNSAKIMTRATGSCAFRLVDQNNTSEDRSLAGLIVFSN